MATIGQKIGRGAREQVRSALAVSPFEIREMRMELEWKSGTDDADGRMFFQGFGNTAQLDEGRDLVEPDAFKESIKTFLRTGRQLYLEHQRMYPVGQIVEGDTRHGQKSDGSDSGLWVRGYVDINESPDTGQPLDHPGAKQIDYARFLVKKGLVRWLSVGWKPEPGFVSFERQKNSAGVEIDVRRIKRAGLYELSLTSFPMNRTAEFAMAKNMLEAMAEFNGIPWQQTPEEPEGHDEEKHDPARPTYKLVSLEGPKPQPAYRLVNLKGEAISDG